MASPISVEAVEETTALIGSHIVRTPVLEWFAPDMNESLPPPTQVYAKLELFQRSGTFKARGALSNIMRMTTGQRQAGVTAMSAGNHAIAVAYASAATETKAKVVMQASANPLRVELAKRLGAEVMIAKDGPTGFDMVSRIARDEGRAIIPPFDGQNTALGTATLGLEMHEQIGDLDVIFIAVGGGGLAGGVSAVIKQLNPACHIVGVEPVGADSMYRSFASGKAEQIGPPETVADSLAPPMTLPFPFKLCHENVDQLVLVTDDEMLAAMNLIFRELKLAVEPACAATTAALLRTANEWSGKRIGLILCGSNIDFETYRSLLAGD